MGNPVAGACAAAGRVTWVAALTGGLVILGLCGEAQGQQRNQLACQGVVGDTPAALSGVREYAAHNALGDGYVRFNGTVVAGGIAGRVSYEGYTRTAPFQGLIATSQGSLPIGVLDNTGGRLVIYGGRPSLGPPDMIGRFVCDWR